MRRQKRTTPGNYVTYLRRTPLEIASGTNELDDQRTIIRKYLEKTTTDGVAPKVIKEFVEVADDLNKDRPELIGKVGAILHSLLTGSSLVVVSMDRLPHDIGFVATIMEQIDILSCDLPYGCDAPIYDLNLHMATIFLESKTFENKEDRRLLVSRVRDLLHIEKHPWES